MMGKSCGARDPICEEGATSQRRHEKNNGQGRTKTIAAGRRLRNTQRCKSEWTGGVKYLYRILLIAVHSFM